MLSNHILVTLKLQQHGGMMLLQLESVDSLLDGDLGNIGKVLDIVNSVATFTVNTAKKISEFYKNNFDWKIPTIGTGINANVIVWSNLSQTINDPSLIYTTIFERALVSYGLGGLFVKHVVEPLANTTNNRALSYTLGAGLSLSLWCGAEAGYFALQGLNDPITPTALDFVYSVPLVITYIDDMKGYEWTEHPNYEDTNLYLHRR